MAGRSVRNWPQLGGHSSYTLALLRVSAHGNARGRQVVVLCRYDGSQRGEDILGRKAEQATKATPYEMVSRS